jgi:hypothetical protein
MWLIELFGAKKDATIESGVYSTNDCNVDTNNIEFDDYTAHKLNLCNSWPYNSKKRLLILKKGQGAVFTTPKNERLVRYYYEHSYDIWWYNDFIIFEYLTEEHPLSEKIDFYVNTRITCYLILHDITISNPSDLIAYIRGKTLNISIRGAGNPKYSIQFDDDCRYYLVDSSYYEINTMIIKKPFLIMAYLSLWSNIIYFYIYATPKLMADMSVSDSYTSTYDPNMDQSMSIDSIVSEYFNSETMSGVQHDVHIGDHDNTFGYNLVRAFLGFVSSEAVFNYDFDLGGTSLSAFYGSLPSDDFLMQSPLYTYFPLLRPKLDSGGYFYPYPQYDPLDESSKIQYLYISLSLSDSNSINTFHLSAFYSLNNYGTPCYINVSGSLPSWDQGWCNFNSPFRFVGAANCDETETDYWGTESLKKNANYLFKIAKLPETDTYAVKGVGCNEVTQAISFNADHLLSSSLGVIFFESLRKVDALSFGYPFDGLMSTLSGFGLSDSETCFVVFSSNLIEGVDDFTNIHTSIRNTLPNSIICYIGDDSNIPDDLRNKVIHSDAIVTDLDTGEAMSLVIKYIRYAKKLHQLFNG